MNTNPFNRKTFCKRLREARELSKLTQAEVAERCDASPAVVSFYECGSRLPGPEMLTALCVATGANPAWLLGMID